jgi:phospho-N-acetylmuramoyl-pentapeptide-transferase
VIGIIISIITSLIVSLIGTPPFIKFLSSRNLGQQIRQDGPTSHMFKRGTPTMGGVIIIIAVVSGWLVSSIVLFFLAGKLPQASSFLLIFLIVGMGLVGFLDDFIKIVKVQSLGLRPWQKIFLQLTIGTIFCIASISFPNRLGITPASMNILVVEKVGLDLNLLGKTAAIIVFIIWINFLLTAWTNAINLTDGLDGLATGCSIFAFGGYVIMSIWMSNKSCEFITDDPLRCYFVRDPWDLAIIAGALAGASFGFLWWNTTPAKIFMGDTGSLALGGAFAGLSIFTNTEILAVIIGGIFVLETFSDVIQVSYFKLTKKRVFKMAPIHHHFELIGWSEETVVVRFWMLSAMFTVVGMAIFYAQWLVGLKL